MSILTSMKIKKPAQRQAVSIKCGNIYGSKLVNYTLIVNLSNRPKATDTMRFGLLS